MQESRRTTAAALALAMCLSSSAAGTEQGSHTGLLAGFGDFVDTVRTSWEIPGMGVAVVKDGAVVVARGFGLRDAERGLPATTGTIFPLGSSTKSFTALALGMLAEDGALDLDDPVATVIADFRLHDDEATLHVTTRDLLSHRTGLPGQYDMLWLLRPMTRDELFARLRYLEPNAGLRERFQYSNVGYVAAGTVLERLSGMTWEEFLVTRIFRPLGMTRTGFVEPAEEPEDDRALPYRCVGGTTSRVSFSGSVAFENVSFLGPAGYVSSTVDDMAKWLLFHLGGGRVGDKQLIAEATLGELFTRQTEITDPGYRMVTQAEAYGLGWAISDYRGRRVLNHGGNIEGFSSLVSLMPEIGAGVVVLSNTMNLAGYAISRNAYDRLSGLEPQEWNGQLRELYAVLEQAHAQASRLALSASDVPGSANVESHAGVYQHPAFGSVDVTVVGGSPAIRFESGVRAELQHVSTDTFRGTTGEFYLPAVEVRFGVQEGGIVEDFSLILQPGAPEVRFTRIGR